MTDIFDVIVVGAGPCGVASCIEAKSAGFNKVLLLEKGDDHNQTLRKFYKDGKRVDKEYKGQDSETRGVIEFMDGNKESTLEYFSKLLNDKKINLIVFAEVESVKKDQDVFKVSSSKGQFLSKNVVISIGKMGKPNKPDYKIPSSLNSVVNFNTNSCKGNEKILVIGGGNSAVEYAIDLSQNNNVSLAYRKTSFSRVNDTNLNDLEERCKNGIIDLRLGCDVMSIDVNNSRPEVHFIDGNVEVFDRLIYAIGGSNPVDFLQKCGINLDEKKNPILDENYESSVKGLYIGGDLALKSGGSIVVGLNHASSIISKIRQDLN